MNLERWKLGGSCLDLVYKNGLILIFLIFLKTVHSIIDIMSLMLNIDDLILDHKMLNKTEEVVRLMNYMRGNYSTIFN